MYWVKRVFSILSVGLLAYSELALSVVHATYQAPVGKVEKRIQQTLKASGEITTVVSLINDTFRLKQRVRIVFGGEDGPLFDPEVNEIVIPYFFMQEVKARFLEDGYAETGVTVEEATMDALIHTLFHELAHALVAIYQLPVLGKEEDAADGLATLLLIQFYDEGQEIAISAADLFDLESLDKDVLEEEDFWGEHSLDEQRFYSTLCYVYGSDPVAYAHLLKDAGFSPDRAELCIDEYEQALKSWQVLLKPYLKPGVKW